MKKIIALVLMLSMLFSLFAVPMGALAQENDNNFTISQLLAVSSEDETTESEDSRVWFDLEGNSELFMLYDTNAESAYSTRTSRKDFTPGVDFGGYLMEPTGDKEADYNTIASNTNNNMGCLTYTLNATVTEPKYTSPANLTKDANNNVWWEIEGVSYKVDVDSKVIKLYPGVDTSLISASTTLTQDKKDELIADYASLSEMTIDVENQKYSKIGLLAGIVCGQNKNIKVTLVYEDAEETKTVNIKAPVVDKNKSYKDGQMYLIKMNDTSNALRTMGQTVFAPYEIEPISTKVLDKIILKPESYTATPKRPIFTISAWGEKAKDLTALEKLVAELNDLNTAGVENIAQLSALESKIAEIDTYLTENSAELTAEQKVVYDQAKNLAKEKEDLKLTERKYEYLNFAKDRDVFVTYQDLIDYGRFNTAAIKDGSSISRINEKYTAEDGNEYFRWLPHETSKGVKVTGQEDYYFRGFQNSANNNIPAVGSRGNVSTSTYAYLADSFFEENGTALNGERVQASTSHTPTDYLNGTIKREEKGNGKAITAPDYVQKIDENGYAIIKNGETQHKIGPVSKTEIKPNALRLGNSDGTEIANINTKGTSLDLLITSTTINTAGYTTSKLGTGTLPTAALQEVVVKYKDGTYDNKKVLVVNNASTSASNTAYRSIVYAPAKDDNDNIIEYNNKSFYLEADKYEFNMLKAATVESVTGLTIDKINKDTVKFDNEDIIYSTAGTVASMVLNRMDTANSNYGAYSSYASIPLENKDVESISFPYNVNSAVQESSAIVVATGTGEDSIALLPVEIKEASKDYVYFVYCGRVAADSYLMGATIMDLSAKEKIDNAKAAMSAITENSTLEEANKAKELYERAIEDSLVTDEHFGATFVENFITTYEKVRENTPLYADVDLKFYTDEAPRAKVTIFNKAQYKGKPYSIIMAYYDENEEMLDTFIKNNVTTTEEEITVMIENADFPAGTKKVKLFVWKNFETLLPICEATVTEETDKKIYMFVGDSITHSDEYRTHTEAFFMTRFPDKVAEFTNAGRSGGTATTALRRVEWDMKRNDATHAVIMFGMNDINLKTNYNPGANTSDEEKQKSINNCLTSLETLAGMLEEDGIDITFMTPSIYDERDYSVATTNYVGSNAALTIVGNGMKALAAAKGYSIIDTNTNMNEVNKKIWNTGVMEMNIKDRIHPTSAGTYVIAYNVIKGLFPNSEVVAEVALDASAKTSNANNATVTDVKFENGNITYNYTAKALPWAATESYKTAAKKYVDLTNELNREIIKVSGLEDGTYTVKFDGVEIGSFTNKELEAGVNIAILDKNPGQVQSQEVYSLLNQKHLIYQALRKNAQAEDTLRARGIHEDPDKIAKYVADGEAAGDDMTIYKNYASEKLLEAERYAQMADYTIKARKKAIPTTHVVTISK